MMISMGVKPMRTLRSGSPLDAEGLREPRLHERVAVLLAADVISGRLPTTAAFPSAEEIVSRFDVSRTVAREALQTVSMLGLVRVQHGKRTEVLPSDDWDVLSPVVQEAMRREGCHEPLWRDLYEFRLLIEPQAAAWMAERASERDLARLAAIAEGMLVRSEAGDANALLAADEEFHRLIARAGGNRVLSAFSRSFWESLSVLWIESRLEPDEMKDVARQHERIADAITRRDPEAARSAMTEHLMNASNVDVGHLSSRAQ
jgi:DNA-binding FadR family transcriptional regulator